MFFFCITVFEAVLITHLFSPCMAQYEINPPTCLPDDLSPPGSTACTEGPDYISPPRAAWINKESVFSPLQSQPLANNREEGPDRDKIKQPKKN